VLWWHTENLPTDDPERAWRLMAHTAMHADDIRRQAGGKTTGRKAEKPVYWFSLSWHEEQQPVREHMIVTGRSALAALGFQEHQAVMVSHGDGVPHIHVIVNSIHPETGRSHTPEYSKLTLSQWAEAYEREHGKIYCEDRVKNNEDRAKGEPVKHHDKKLITRLYQEAKSPQAFKASLEKYGYQLAQGNKLLLIDRTGKVSSLSRQVDGVTEKDMRAYFREIELRKFTEETNRQAQRRNEEQAAQRKRDEQEKAEREEQQKKTRTARQPAQQLKEAAQPDKSADAQKTQAVRRNPKPERYNGLPMPTTVVRLENQQRDERDSFLETNRVIRERWQWQLSTQRDRERAERLRLEIADYEKQRQAQPDKPSRWAGRRARSQAKEIEDRLIEMRVQLAGIEEREAQQRARDEQEAREHMKGLQGLRERHERERQELHADPKTLLSEKGRNFNERGEPEKPVVKAKEPAREIARETERPLAQLPATLQDKIKESGAQQQQARRLEQAQTVAQNDNRKAEQRTPDRTEQARSQVEEDAPANDNRTRTAQTFNHVAKPPQKAAPDFNRAAQPAPARQLQPVQAEQSKEPDADRAAREAQLDLWQAQRDSQRQQAQAQETSARGTTGVAFEQAAQPETSEEDAARYAMLDAWNAAQTYEAERTRAEQEASASSATSAVSAEDAARHALLDGWAQTQDRSLDRGMEMDF
jgi:hypothetical protein